MKIKNIFKEGIAYPSKDVKKLLILGIITTIIIIPFYIIAITRNQNILPVGIIIALILTILLEGYKVNIIKEGTERSDYIPQLHPKNFITGIKSLIITIIYYIIPLILTILSAFPTGLITNIINIRNMILKASASGVTSITIDQAQYTNLYNSIILTLFIGLIFFTIFAIFANISQAKLAETNSMKSALNIKAVIEKLNKIGWAQYIAYIIITLVVVIFLSGFMVLFSIIPYVGIIIDSIFLYPILYLFLNYTIGLVYRTN